MGCLEAKMGLKVAEIRSAKFLYVIDFYLKTGKMRCNAQSLLSPVMAGVRAVNKSEFFKCPK